jgi:hypothetical protein
MEALPLGSRSSKSGREGCRVKRKILALALAGGVVALGSGCASMTPTQQRALSGGAIGAAGGAVLGAVAGGNPAVWAAVGGAVGASVGALMNKL